MKSLSLLSRVASLTVALVFLIGCGASDPEPVAVIEEATPEPTNTTEDKKPKKKSYSLIANSFEAAEASLDKGDYDKAVQVLLKMQLSGQLKNNKDSWRYSSLMSQVQSELASAAADGDKKAQRAIEMLRQSRGPM